MRVYILNKDKRPEGTQIFLDGKEVTRDLLGFRVEQDAGQVPRLVLIYACYDQLTIEGQMDIHHVCPKKAR